MAQSVAQSKTGKFVEALEEVIGLIIGFGAIMLGAGLMKGITLAIVISIPLCVVAWLAAWSIDRWYYGNGKFDSGKILLKVFIFGACVGAVLAPIVLNF